MFSSTVRNSFICSLLVSTIFTIALLLTPQHSDASVPGEGAVFGGGGLLFNMQNEEIEGSAFGDIDQSSSTFSITPRIGYYLTDEFVVGLGFGVELITIEDNLEDTEASRSVYSVGPFVRYSEEIAGNLRIYGEVGAMLGTGSGEEETPGSNDINADISTLEVGLRPGLTYYLSESFAIEPSFGFFGFQSESISTEEELVDGLVAVNQESSEFTIDLSLSTISLSMHYYF